ncbi:MAG: ATP-binding protein [Shimia sp.]|uniref:ATP-binding protein n=1 Tax=Shimia sp. TaxID=1954381 RepID=UPI004058D765
MSFSGQRVIVANSENIDVFGRTMVAVAEMAVAFDHIAEGEEIFKPRGSLEVIRQYLPMLQRALEVIEADGFLDTLAPANQAYLAERDVPAGSELRKVQNLAETVLQNGVFDLKTWRASHLAADKLEGVLKSLVHMNRIEIEAIQSIVERQVRYSLIAAVIGLMGVFVAVRFVHLPMERFILNSHRKIREGRQKAQAASVAKSVFLETMSHEIRTPLNGVLGLGQVLLDGEEDPERRRMLTTMQTSGSSLLYLVNDILDLAKIESGNSGSEREDFDLESLCREVVALFRAASDQKQVELSFDAEALDRPWFVDGYAKAVRQIVFNLVSNAVKFTDDGSVHVQLGIVGAPNPVGDMLVSVTVRDTGVGIPSEAQPQIFDRFTRVDGSATSRHAGSGLGLAISKRLADEIGGDITVESGVGVGATFTFVFPVASLKSEPKPADIDLDTTCYSGRVLVVDDNRVNRIVAQKMLKGLGFEVDIAVNGADAVHHVAATRPDLVLMDVRMPVMDGLEATQKILAADQLGGRVKTLVFGLSANGLPEHQKAGLDAGMVEYITKPLQKAELVRKLGAYFSPVTKPTSAPEDAPECVQI